MLPERATTAAAAPSSPVSSSSPPADGSGAAAALGIVVGGEWRAWEAGRCLLMDDSFEHSVDLRCTHHSAGGAGPARTADGAADGTARTRPQQRVLLVCDVWHPDAGAAGLRAASAAGAVRRPGRMTS